jgi:MFS family permease
MSPPPAHKEGTVPAPQEPMPPDIHNVYIYEVFNTASWSVVLGSPMLLYFQHLNASATILAIAACLAPVLNILQIPAAHFVEKVGYRRFVLSGWTTRSIVVVGMTLVAFLPDSVDRATRIVLMLSLSLIYNTYRAREPARRISGEGSTGWRICRHRVPLHFGLAPASSRFVLIRHRFYDQRRLGFHQPHLFTPRS